MLILTRRILLTLLVLNWVAVAGFVLFGGALLVMPEFMTAQLTEEFGGNGGAVRVALIGMMAIGSVAAVPVHFIFARIIAMIDTVRAGTPFAPINADRLRQVAWGMLALQIVDLGYGWFATQLSAATGEFMAWQFSITGWLAVLLLFVLARVFQQGAALQDEIEGTV
jgi:hypothetical protein